MGELLAAYAHRRLGIDKIYGHRGAHVVDESGCRIDVERCAYDDEYVGLLGSLGCYAIMGTDSPKKTMNGRSSDPSPESVPGRTSQLSSVNSR